MLGIEEEEFISIMVAGQLQTSATDARWMSMQRMHMLRRGICESVRSKGELMAAIAVNW